MKNAFQEAILRRKKGNKPSYQEDEQNKKQDLAPEVKDIPGAKLEIEIGMKPQMPPEMGDAGEEMEEMKEPDDMSGFIDEEEKKKLMMSNQKPKSLLERAQKAFLEKK